MMLSPVYFVITALTLASAKPYSESLVVHERRRVAPSGFGFSGPAPAEQTLHLRINLVQHDFAGLESAIYAASTPDSPSYGRWLSKDEVEACGNAVVVRDDITSATASAAGDWISLSLSVGKANELLRADFSVFTYTENGQEVVRTLEYSIPASLRRHIRLVTPTISLLYNFRFDVPRRGPLITHSAAVVSERPSRVATALECNSTITPTCLQTMYNIPSWAATNKTNAIEVAGYSNEWANQEDLTQFLETHRPDIPANTSFDLIIVDGGTNSQNRSQAGIETGLDVQYVDNIPVGVATGVPVTFVSVGNATRDNSLGFLDILTALMAEDSPPQVLTISYGFSQEADLSEALTFSMCDAYAQVSVSILFASGDGGVATTPGNECTGKPFLPTFPSCPYVTLVGATVNSAPETGSSITAGGFSNYFPQQLWQADTVNNYLSQIGTLHEGLYNASGRAYPDVSCIGEHVSVVWRARSILIGGTSASSPIFASVIGLLNDELLNAGRPVLGFLNPWLYANPQARVFNDITAGSNPGCGTSGFPAKSGWDPVTGLGSPNYVAMRT
ncbi:family S53 protease [Mycena rebaudengoi]|nr:family S53 protease [Mycena rebaudengoi]